MDQLPWWIKEKQGSPFIHLSFRHIHKTQNTKLDNIQILSTIYKNTPLRGIVTINFNITYAQNFLSRISYST